MIYFFDGTKQAFLTAFLLAYRDDDARLCCGQKQLSMSQEVIFVVADKARADKAEARLKSFDGNCIGELELLLRSGDPAHEDVAFRYLKKIAGYKKPVRNMLADDDVLRADEYLRRIRNEIHRMHGFVRFIESVSGVLYAPISPDHDICDLLVPHFRARLAKYPFVIHDVKRKKAAVFDGKQCFCAPLEQAEIVLSAHETQWQELWKRYYRSVNIPSRERLRQMRGYLPVRYRKFMPEFEEPTLREPTKK